MEVKDLPKAVLDIGTQVAKQQSYVTSLANKFNAGQSEIEVFTEAPDVWTNVPLQAFWSLQNDKLLAMMTYQGTLNGALTQLQAKLDELLLGVVPPPVNK